MKGQLLSVGAGLDMRGSFRSCSLVVVVDVLMGQPGSLTASASLSFLDGGGRQRDLTFFTWATPRKIVPFVEAGCTFKEFDSRPYVE